MIGTVPKGALLGRIIRACFARMAPLMAALAIYGCWSETSGNQRN